VGSLANPVPLVLRFLSLMLLVPQGLVSFALAAQALFL
jgi:hypothetical protein